MPKECEKCLFLQAGKLINRHNIANKATREIIDSLNVYVNKNRDNGLLAPEASRFLNHLIEKTANSNDIYKKEKEEFNNLMLSLEDKIDQVIQQSENPFQTALRYALAGNIIDFGPPDPFDVLRELDSASSRKPAIDDSEILYKKLISSYTIT